MPHRKPPTRRTCLAAALLIVLAAPLAAQTPPAGRATGSGRVVTETRAVAGYRRIELRAPLTVTLLSRGREGLELRGDDNLLPLLETRVADGTLVVDWKPGTTITRASELHATIDVAAVERLVLAGAGTVGGELPPTPQLSVALDGAGGIRLAGLQVGSLGLRLAGSGDLQAAGRADRLSVSISGSGDVDAERLEAGEVAVSITGSGDAAVAARKALKVSIVGSGDVVYRGDAVPQVSTTGSGRVRRR